MARRIRYAWFAPGGGGQDLSRAKDMKTIIEGEEGKDGRYCPVCSGKGYVVGNKCAICDGWGVQVRVDLTDISP